MPTSRKKYIALDRFLAKRQQGHPEASGELTRVLYQIGVVAKIISGYMRRAAIEGLLGYTGEVNVQGEEVKKLDELGNSAFVDAFEYVDIVGAIVSEEMEQPVIVSSDFHREKCASTISGRRSFINAFLLPSAAGRRFKSTRPPTGGITNISKA